MRARKAVSGLTTTQKTKLLTLLNEGSAEELVAIQGIGAGRAQALESARPFNAIDELVGVRGIGESIFADVIAHGRSLTARRSSSRSSRSSRTKGS